MISSRHPRLIGLYILGTFLLAPLTITSASENSEGKAEEEIIREADALWFQASRLDVDDGGAKVLAEYEKASAKLRPLVEKGTTNPTPYWMIVRNQYDMGEILARTKEEAEKNEERRLKMYDEMIRLSRKCIEVAPEDGNCWHWLATSLGRKSTAEGVLDSLFTADEVEAAWLRAYKLNPQYKTEGGEPQMNNIRYGLGVFYRMVPDSWLVSLVAGVRGDISKATQYFRDAVKAEPYRIELHKELAVALLCWADREDEAEKAKEGRAILNHIVAGKFDGPDPRNTDPTDKRHAQELLDNPDIACGYSRDGIQDLDESKIKK